MEASLPEIRLLSTSGILGYGFPEESLNAGLARKPHMVGCDGGSSDPGPYYLGAGKPFASPMAIRRDLRLMLKGAIEHGIPMVVGTCGGAGGAPHLDLVAAMVRDIAAEEGLHFRMALIHAEQDKALIKRRIAEGRSRPLGRMKPLDADTVDRADRIVGMMGPEPYMRALDEGAQVVLGGRSSDPAPFAAVAMRAQLPPAPSWYAGKMLECGATPSIPKGHDCLLVTVRDDGVECEPTNPIRRCTPVSVANHSLHENSSPIHHYEPGGMLDTSDCRFDALTDRAVKVSGMRWEKADAYSVKLEAVEQIGHRAISICGTRDPLLISTLAPFLQSVKDNVRAKAQDFGVAPEEYTLTIRSYGHDGVMAEREPVHDIAGHELGFLIDVVAQDPDRAAAVLAMARTNMLHTDFPGRLCREGNMAFPFSPSDIPVGPVFRFTMSHVVLPDDPCEMFPITYETI